MTGALLVDVDGRPWKGLVHGPGPAGVVEVDVGDGDARELVRSHAELVEGLEEDGDRALAARLDQHGRSAVDQIARRDAVPAPEPGVDLGHACRDRRRHGHRRDRKSTRLNSSHVSISYAVFCLKKKKKIT